MKFWLAIICGLISGQSLAQLPHVASGKLVRWELAGTDQVSRTVEIWLPDGYSSRKKYSVLYMHDGQMLFDSTQTWNKQEWMVDETIGSLMAAHKIRNTIVVAIFNRAEHRRQDYFPEKALGYLDSSVRSALIEKELMGKAMADEYLRFLVYTLKPKVDSAFSTRAEKSNTFIAGSSMGGLISLYAYCEYPTVFGGAACISTHWPGSLQVRDPSIPIAINQYLEKRLPQPTGRKLYFDHGDQTLDSLYPPLQAKVDEICKRKGYKGKRWASRSFPGEDHSERAWQQRFDEIALFLLGKGNKKNQ